MTSEKVKGMFFVGDDLIFVSFELFIWMNFERPCLSWPLNYSNICADFIKITIFSISLSCFMNWSQFRLSVCLKKIEYFQSLQLLLTKMHHRKGRGWKNNTKTKSFFPFYLLVKSLIKGIKGHSIYLYFTLIIFCYFLQW